MEDNRITREDALAFHLEPTPGKWEINATVPMTTQRDLSLAYSPGVAVPCEDIAANPELAYDYTNKGNLVAVISNGTVVLGLGHLGALGSKPVMEGKAVLFKRFADVNSIDIELDTEDPDAFCNAVRLMGPTFGGINLEDIKAPECFIIEQRLKEEMDIPVFHDDQHGTAVICAAGLLNALHISGKKIENVKIVLNGAGAAGIACIELLKAMGVKHDNCVVCDTKGVIYQGRTEGMNQWKSAHAITTELRTLEEAMKGADVFLGVSVKGAVTADMVVSMGDNPVIFAMANPDPEITPEEAHAVRVDAIVATGRSDYPNQVNNVLGFPYLFRGALDIHARAINDEMKIACAHALAKLAREDVPDEVRELRVVNAANTEHLDTYKEFLYKRLQRKGHDHQDIHRLASRDRHVFASLMLAHGHADGMVTGATRKSAHVLELINHVFDAGPHDGAVGVTSVLSKGRIVLISDTLVHEWPDENDLADIAERSAYVARALGLEPRVAFLSFSTFGYPVSERAEKMHMAPDVLEARGVDFEYEGEMTVDVALNTKAQEAYPFSRLTGPANILVVPARHSASISVKLMQKMGGATVIGPILAGIDCPIQICSTGSTVNDILNMAVLASSTAK